MDCRTDHGNEGFWGCSSNPFPDLVVLSGYTGGGGVGSAVQGIFDFLVGDGSEASGFGLGVWVGDWICLGVLVRKPGVHEEFCFVF